MNNVLQGGGQYEVMDYGDYIRRIADDSDGQSAPKGYLSVFRVFDAFPELSRTMSTFRCYRNSNLRTRPKDGSAPRAQ